jgi:hypothetical protein
MLEPGDYHFYGSHVSKRKGRMGKFPYSWYVLLPFPSLIFLGTRTYISVGVNIELFYSVFLEIPLETVVRDLSTIRMA